MGRFAVCCGSLFEFLSIFFEFWLLDGMDLIVIRNGFCFVFWLFSSSSSSSSPFPSFLFVQGEEGERDKRLLES